MLMRNIYKIRLNKNSNKNICKKILELKCFKNLLNNKNFNNSQDKNEEWKNYNIKGKFKDCGK